MARQFFVEFFEPGSPQPEGDESREKSFIEDMLRSPFGGSMSSENISEFDEDLSVHLANPKTDVC
jgi:hypothetical protein